MMQFQGFKPEAMNRIAKTLGYESNMGSFQDFLNNNPDKKQRMEGFNKKAVQMMQGGYVKGYAPGGFVNTEKEFKAKFIANATRNLGKGDGGLFVKAKKDADAAWQKQPKPKPAPPPKPNPAPPPKPIPVAPPKPKPPGATKNNMPSWMTAPPPGSNVTQALQTFTNPTTGETYTAPSGGYSMNTNIPGNLIAQYGAPKMDTFEEFKNRQPIGPGSGFTPPSDEVIRPRYEKYVDFFNSGASEIPGGGLDNFGPGGVDPRTTPRSNDPLPPSMQPLFGGGPLAGSNAPKLSMPPVPQVSNNQTIGQSITDRAYNPQLPQGSVVQPVGTNVTTGQLIDPRQGQVAGDIISPISSAATGTAQLPTATATNQVTAATSAAGVAGVLDQNTAAQGQIADESQVEGQLASASAVSNLNAAQGTGILMSNPTQRKIESGELVSGVANAETASNYAEKIQAAQATPTKEATIQGQLEGLMQAFEGGNTPAWAAGALRNASAGMAARGLGASSMAGQAMVQAAMESALPIAQADASVIANFEAQNLSNRQQRAMLAAEQRATFMGMEFDQAFQSRVMNASKISDIANMNFTAEQQVALENSRIANTVNLTNLNNKQAMVLAEASALSNIDMANLSNRQQAAVQNAQSFLQMDMVNLTNRQQTNMFKAQQRVQSLFTDQAAVNASRQFNASSANQTDQFFANLRNTTAQFNTSQVNAQEQFNSGEANAMNKFSAEIMNQRDQFNAQNRLIIDQSNAQWRREVATADTVAVNRANELNANSVLEMSNTAYNDLWQYYADSMEWAWTSADNTMERMNQLALSELSAEAQLAVANAQATSAAGSAIGNLIGTLGSAYISGMFPATKFVKL